MTDLDAPAAARPMTEAEIRWLRQRAEGDVRFLHANLSAHWMRRVLATLDAAVEERDRLRAAAERLPRYAMVGALNARRMEPTRDGNFVLLYDLRAALHPEAGT